MRKLAFITAIALVIGACSKESVDIVPGSRVGEIRVGAQPGSVSVSVETAGRWKVSVEESSPWLTTDVVSGKDDGAFTLSFGSNTSDIADIRPSRRARVLLVTEEYKRCDTLLLYQSGFGSGSPSPKVYQADGLSIEFDVPAIRTMEVAYCSAAGLESESELASWSSSFDVVACGDHFLIPQEGTQIPGLDASELSFGGVSFVSADFLLSQNREAMFRDLLEKTVNAAGAGAHWVLGGQLFHLSMMQSGYPGTPQWYPADGSDAAFAQDRYAWMNNMYDCLWLCEQNYISTWEDAQSGHSYQADYTYVSRSVLSRVVGVRLADKPVSAMEHRPIVLTLEY